VELTELLASNSAAPSSPARPANGASALGSDDFFQLLITQLTNQDPLEPTGNEELLRQISSIREIELSTTLTESLRALTGQQQFGSASSLIGQYVTGLAQDGTIRGGIVQGIRFDGGNAVLHLSNGAELPLAQLNTIESPLSAAQALVGQRVVGISRSGTSQTELVEGVVTGATADSRGEATLELDTGESLALRDVFGVQAAD
jgi:flagellar basal-body rod modification protein FlgD